MKTKKNINRNVNNKNTRKCIPSQIQLKHYCKEHANTFNRFEEEFEKKINSTKYGENIEKSLIKLFNTPFTPKEYKQKDDYYTYINYSWINEKSEEAKKTQKYYVQIDSFRITQEKVYYELIDIVEEYTKTKKTHRVKHYLVFTIMKTILVHFPMIQKQKKVIKISCGHRV
jgi:nitrate/nitrite-specific signal transduction histidine kinase